MNPKDTFDLIREQEKLGNVVFATIEGLQGMKLDDMISQPTEGLLYDLNRDKATCATWIGQEVEGWINNYAVALVITRLKEKLEAYEKGLYTCPDCGYNVSGEEFLTGGDTSADEEANELMGE